MKIKFFPVLFAALLVAPAGLVWAASPPPPGYENSLPYASQQPALPYYLPGGGVNLDEAWTRDGGARMYWNSTYIPKQLNMAGATWVDPALVPELVIQQQKKQPVKKRVTRRYYKRKVAVKKPVRVARAPKNAGSRSLRSPAIPLPVTPIPPLSANQPQTPPVTPPRLQ